MRMKNVTMLPFVQTVGKNVANIGKKCGQTIIAAACNRIYVVLLIISIYTYVSSFLQFVKYILYLLYDEKSYNI